MDKLLIKSYRQIFEVSDEVRDILASTFFEGVAKIFRWVSGKQRCEKMLVSWPKMSIIDCKV